MLSNGWRPDRLPSEAVDPTVLEEALVAVRSGLVDAAQRQMVDILCAHVTTEPIELDIDVLRWSRTGPTVKVAGGYRRRTSCKAAYSAARTDPAEGGKLSCSKGRWVRAPKPAPTELTRSTADNGRG